MAAADRRRRAGAGRSVRLAETRDVQAAREHRPRRLRDRQALAPPPLPGRLAAPDRRRYDRAARRRLAPAGRRGRLWHRDDRLPGRRERRAARVRMVRRGPGSRDLRPDPDRLGPRVPLEQGCHHCTIPPTSITCNCPAPPLTNLSRWIIGPSFIRAVPQPVAKRTSAIRCFAIPPSLAAGGSAAVEILLAIVPRCGPSSFARCARAPAARGSMWGRP